MICMEQQEGSSWEEKIPCRIEEKCGAVHFIEKSHCHRDMEIQWITEGTVLFFRNGRKIPVSRGQLLVIAPGEVHSSIPSFDAACELVKGITVRISGAFLEQYLPELPESDIRWEEHGEELQRWIDVLLHTERKGHGELIVLAKTAEMLYQMAGWMEQRQRRCISGSCQVVNLHGEDCMIRILDYVFDHYRENILQSQVAEKQNYSKEYFCRMFKKHLNLSFKQFLIRYRLLKAEELLLRSDLHLSIIAGMVGMNDEAQLIRLFRERYGMTPGVYRKLRRGKP